MEAPFLMHLPQEGGSQEVPSVAMLSPCLFFLASRAHPALSQRGPAWPPAPVPPAPVPPHIPCLHHIHGPGGEDAHGAGWEEKAHSHPSRGH